MRVVKRIYSRDPGSRLLSRAFNEALKEIEVPVPFDYLEFKIGYDSMEISGSAASFGISTDDPMLYMDMRVAKALVKLELYRIFVRNIITREIPAFIEYVIAAREMAKHGLADDLASMFYAYMVRHRIADFQTFLKFNVAWIIFYSCDSFYCDLFQQLATARRRYAYEHRSKELFDALLKDLMDFENLKAAVDAYENAMNAK